MEAKVHEELLSFLGQHSLEDTVSNIDDIVLSYLVSVVELLGQGDDGLDIVELIEMMNAYLPGFDQIRRSEVIDWMFGLASKLIGGMAVSHETRWNEEELSLVTIKSEELLEVQNNTGLSTKDRKFPTYDYMGKLVWDSSLKNASSTDCVDQQGNLETPVKHERACNDGYDSVEPFHSFPAKHTSSAVVLPLLTLPEVQGQQSCSKRKGRQLSCSSQDSQDDFPKTDGTTIEEAQVRILLDMFPSACTMEARHCLQLSAGNMDRAAQLIMDRQDTGQAFQAQAKTKTMKKNHKVKKTVDYKLDDDSIKSCVLERYSFIDTEEDKKTYRPPPPKGEAKKLVRYRDGQVVSMKGERFSEIKEKEDDMKASYINLKPARKYRFH